MIMITRAVSTPQHVERGESRSMFCETPFAEIRTNRVESMKI